MTQTNTDWLQRLDLSTQFHLDAAVEPSQSEKHWSLLMDMSLNTDVSESAIFKIPFPLIATVKCNANLY